MQVPLEIAFHNTESSEWAEDEIRGRVAELEEIYGRLISCRVRVDQRAENRAGTIPPVVRIELRIPGHKDLVVSHEPEHLLRKYQRPDLRNAIHEAFRIAQRRLRDLKEQREGRTKEPRHDSENQSLGQVVELTPDADHGFLLTKEGGLLYFHRNAVLIGDFDRLDRGDEVYYVEDLGDTGVVLAFYRAPQRRRGAVRPGVELGERRPVGREKMRLRLRAQHRLAEVIRVLLVGRDGVLAHPEDRYLLAAETEIARSAMDDQRAEAVSHNGQHGVTRS